VKKLACFALGDIRHDFPYGNNFIYINIISKFFSLTLLHINFHTSVFPFGLSFMFKKKKKKRNEVKE